MESCYTIGESFTAAPTNAYFQLHNHNDYEILFFLEGDAKYVVEDKMYTLEPGDLIIIRKHEFHRIYHNSPTPYRRAVLMVSPAFFQVQKTVVTGIEMFRKMLDEAQAGDNIGALLRGINRDQIVRGQVLAKPGSVTCHSKFTAQVYVLTKDEGGRHTPFFNNYRPQFYFRTTDVTGVCQLPSGTEMCMPGDNVEMTIELIHPVAMEQGLTFAIREGGRTVGSGRVATIVE